MKLGDVNNMNEQIKIRIADKSDIDQLVKMRIDYLKEDVGENEVNRVINLEQELHNFFECNLNQGIDAFVAEYKGEIISTSFTTYYHRLPHTTFIKGNVGIPINGYTKPVYRKMGLATKLLEMSVEYARKKGIEVLHMEVTEKGFPVCSKTGFQVTKYKPVQMVLKEICVEKQND
jgi:GNAT superfamily N-acetyltransferase